MAEYKRVASMEGSTGHTEPRMASKKGSHKSTKKISSNNQESHKKSTFFRFTEAKPKTQHQARPTIIRCDNSYTKKKPPPPRPPPPKLNTQSDHNGITTQNPPSYEEVVEADLNAFIGEMKAPRVAPRVPIRPRPPVPSNAHAPKLSLQAATAHKRNSRQQDTFDMLIDFNAPPARLPPTNVKTSSVPSAPSLLDLDDIFSCNGFDTQPSESYQQSSSIQNGLWSPQSNASSSLPSNRLGLGPRVLPPHPVLPRQHSVPGTTVTMSKSSSRGEEWLQSCLMETTNREFSHSQSAFTSQSYHNDGASDGSSFSDFPLQPTSPQPSSRASSASVDYSFDGNNCLPPFSPPVPPLPRSSITSDMNLVADNEPPPLPPRPKWFKEKPCAIANFDYEAAHNDELSFKANELITLIYSVNKDWFYGSCSDSEGMFPKSYVNIVVPLPDSKEEDGLDFSEPCCQALYDFQGETDDELTFLAGDYIVLESKERDWFRGKRNGISGLFPANYVKIIKDLDSPGTINVNSGVMPEIKSNAFTALYDFEGESGELSFNAGDCIIVSGKVNEEWLLGSVKGRFGEGRFPKTFVQPLN